MAATIFGGQARTSGSMRRYRFAACDTRAPWPWVAAGGANGSRVDGAGLVAPSVAPRITRTTEERTNLLTHSNDFSGAGWTAPYVLTPSGRIESNSASAVAHQCYQLGKTIEAGRVYGGQVKAKADQVDWLILNLFDGAEHRAYFNLATGTRGQVHAGFTSTMQRQPDGYWLCTLLGQLSNASVNGGLSVEMTDADGAAVSTIPAEDGLWAKEAQFEADRITDYIATGATPVSVHDGLGVLIEAEAADLVSYPNDPSDGAWGQIDVVATGGAALAPNGEMDAVSIVLSGAANARLDQAFPVAAVAGVTYNYAVWLQGSGNVNIGINTTTGVGGSGEDNIVLTSEWQRRFVPVTYAPGVTGNVRIHAVIDRAGGPSASVLRMWQPQVTLGVRPSSDVMTLTSPLTRAADSLTCTDLTALGMSADAWTIVVTAHEPHPDPTPGYPMILRIEGEDGAVVTINKQPDGQIEFQIYDGAINVAHKLPAGTPGVARKYAIGYSRSQQLMRVAATGAAAVDTSGVSLATLPALGTVRLGSANGFWWINQPIAECAVAPRLLSAAEFIQEVES